jgi:hypothetical protein
VRINAIINVLLERLEAPVQEKRDKVKEKAQSWMEKLKEKLRR